MEIKVITLVIESFEKFTILIKLQMVKIISPFWGPLKGGSGAMCYVQNSLACYVLCKFLFTLLCEIKIGCYAEV